MTAEPASKVIDRLFPSTYLRTRNPALEWIALFAIVLFACSNFIEPALARKGEWLLLLVTMISWRHIRREEPDVWIYLLMLGFLGLMLVLNAWAVSQWGGGYDHFSYSRDYLRMFWFLMAGWWFGGRERSILLVFAVTVAALFISIQIEGGFTSWQQLFKGHRVDFNIHNAQHLGVLFGSVLLGLLAFMFRFLDQRRHPLRRVAMGALWLLMLAATLMVILGTQSRQIWFGFAAAAATTSTYLVLTCNSRHASAWRLTWIALLILSVIAAGLLLHSFESMGKRISSELYAIEQMQTHQLKDTPSTSATIRLTLWRTAAEAIAKRPLTGYGGAARKIVLKDAGLPVHLVGQIGHFHNSYLELWLSYGVLGPLVFIGILILLGWRLIAASRQKCLAPDFALFGLSWLAFFATVNIFESYVSYRSGAYLIFIVGGALYSIAIPARRTIRHHNDGSRPDSRPAPVNGGTSGRSGEQIRAAD